MPGPELLLVNPGGRESIYQALGGDLTAIEPPLWARLIAGYVADRGFSVQILDSEAEALGPDAVARRVVECGPRLVAMVVYGHQPSASTQQMAAASQTCRAIKRLQPDQEMIILGGHVAALPERTLRDEAVDYACNGEGPVTVHHLLVARTRNESLRDVPGLVWWSDGRILNNSPAPLIKDLDKDLHGNVWELLPMARYRAHNWQCFGNLAARQPYASIYTSLGCPYKCTFCCINAPFGVNRYRMRSPNAVVDEIDLLYSRYGVRTIKIIDEMFVLNDAHVTAICEGLARKPYAEELNIWAYARVDTVKPGRLSLLRSAGIRWLALGIESGSEHVRDGAEKSFGENDIIQIVRAIQNAGISVIGNFIFGLPDDDLYTMRQTLNLAKTLNCEFANFYSAMAYPGSPLYALALEQNWTLPSAWTGYSQHSYDCTPLPTAKVSSADVLRFRDDAFHEYFSDKHYLDVVDRRFGPETRRHIEEMNSIRLRRQLLESNSMLVD